MQLKQSFILVKLQEEVSNMVEDAMKNQKLELEKLREEMQEVDEIVNNDMDDFLKTNLKQLLNIEDEMKRHFAHQKAENSRLQQQINNLRNELQSTKEQLEGKRFNFFKVITDSLIGAAKLVSDLEMNVGTESSPDELR